MDTVPTEAIDLLGPPHHATVATILPDGAPQLSVVWVAHASGIPSFNTARGRLKVHNLERDPRCTLLVYDASDPERYLHVRGRARLVADDDLVHHHELARLYTGGSFRELEPGEVRIAVHIDPERVLYRRGAPT